MTFLQETTDVPCYLHLSLCPSEDVSEEVILPNNLHFDHPSLEQIAIKRLKCVEKGSNYPYAGLIFFRGKIVEDDNNNPISEVSSECHAGLFECVQLISQVPDSNIAKSRRRTDANDDGYMVFVYKTMEDMCTDGFTASWKTWTGARFLCTLLPPKYIVKRLSFFKKVRGFSSFAYVMMAQIANMMDDAAPALNVLNCLKPKVCAFVGAYRSVTFKIDDKLCKMMNISEEHYLTKYSSSMKITYNNHTVMAIYPVDVEYRSDGKIEPPLQNEETCRTKSEETQTEYRQLTRRRKRLSLPKTFSIYDFPSMNQENSLRMSDPSFALEVISANLDMNSNVKPENLSEMVDSYKSDFLMDTKNPEVVDDEPTEINNFSGAEVSKTTKKSQTVTPEIKNINSKTIKTNRRTALPYSILIAHPRIMESTGYSVTNLMNHMNDAKLSDTKAVIQTPLKTTEHLSPLKDLAPRKEVKADWKGEKKSISEKEISRLSESREQTLRRLKQHYFQSPEYTAEELKQLAETTTKCTSKVSIQRFNGNRQ